MDSKVMDFLRKADKPCSAYQISMDIGEVIAKVNSTLYDKLEKEGHVERKGTVEGGQAPLWGLVQGGSSDQDEIASDISRPSITLWKDPLNKHHQELRTETFHNIPPALTDPENAQIIDNANNVYQVDERIENRHTNTRKQCSVLDSNGYEQRAERLRKDSGNQGNKSTASKLSVESHPHVRGIAFPPLNAATPPEHPVTHDQTKSQTEQIDGTDGEKSTAPMLSVESPSQSRGTASPLLNAATPPEHPVTHDQPTSLTEQVDGTVDQTIQGVENIRFVFITGNNNEYKSLMSFLKHPEWRLQHPVETTFENIEELKGCIEMKGKFKGYRRFSVKSKDRTVHCAVLKCLSMGSSGCSGSRMETLKLLITALNQHWSPEAIFIIGCCGGVKVPESDAGTVVGRVCISNKVIHYNRGKIEGEGKMNWNPTTDYGSQSTTWYGNIQKEEDEEPHTKKISYKEIDRFLSGDHVVKSEEAAAVLSQYSVCPSNAAIEMEGLGVAEALEIAKLFNEWVIQDADRKIPMPEYVIVKGISDLAGHDKNLPCNIQFFGEEKRDVQENHRQQMCTIMAATLVLRAIVAYA